MKNDYGTSTSYNEDTDGHKYTVEKEVSRQTLINKLNYLNFQDETLLVTFQHTEKQHRVSLRAKPQPCLGEELICTWPESELCRLKRLSSYQLKDVKLFNGNTMTIIHPVDIHINEKGFHLLLPDFGKEVSNRKLKRYPCKGIKAQLLQNSVSFSGKLIDFSALSLVVELSKSPTEVISWLETESKIILILSNDQELLYSGECRIRKFKDQYAKNSLVLEPLSTRIRRFKPREFRSSRQRLIPTPYIDFKHPFTRKKTNIKVMDISISGFSVMENLEDQVLLPGMIIPELDIYWAGTFSVSCKAQVVYRYCHEENDGSGYVKCGMAILDMDIEQHSNILSLLYQTKNDKSFAISQIDQEKLWRFFFESGFIYPTKYAFLENNKDNIKSVYKKLYEKSSRISRYFLYQDKGCILGHMSMIRFYEKAWMIHHHAANTTASGNAGFDVLEQVSRFISESHNIKSLNMNYVFCYFRPENKFPNRIFGGVARNINDPKKCSLDNFLYYHFNREPEKVNPLPEPWTIESAQPDDLINFEISYEQFSGGLMMDTFELKAKFEGLNSLSDLYLQSGLKREKYVFSLKKQKKSKAIILLNKSDIGLNLSDITNSIHIFLTEMDNLAIDVLTHAISELARRFELKDIPVLLFPTTISERQKVEYEKIYQLWILNLQYVDDYYRFMSRFFNKISSLKAFRKS